MQTIDTRDYLVAQAGSPPPTPVPIQQPIKIDDSKPREVVVVDNQTYSPVEVALRKADEAGGALLTLMILALLGFITLGGHKKIFGVFDALTHLINLLKDTQKETTEAVKRNAETLVKVSDNDSKITETLAQHQAVMSGLLAATPEITGKQDEQIMRMKYAIELLKHNAVLLVGIAERLKVEVEHKLDDLKDPDDKH